MIDHGGNLDAAIRRHGGSAADWIDLSTGINRVPYPVSPASPAALTDLPTKAAMEALIGAARKCYGASGAIAPLAGAQQAIQLLPHILPPGPVRILSPTYNEHAASFARAGREVVPVADIHALRGADLAVLVNPNNPDGRHWGREQILGILGDVGTLIIDESFGDICPQTSLAGETGREGLWVLRSFGKFYGLAGLRLGFAIGPEAEIARLAALAGPWPVTGPAIEAGTTALGDRAWQDQTRARLAADARRLDGLLPWRCIGGTDLFRLYDCKNAPAAQASLARHHIWTRIFPWSDRLIRLGLPGPEEWGRVTSAAGSL